MSDIDRLASHFGVSREDAAELLDVLAWVRQQHVIAHRGFPSDTPGHTSDVFEWPAFDAQMLQTATDFEVSAGLIQVLQSRIDAP